MCAPNNTIRKQVTVNSYLEVGPDEQFDTIRDTQDLPEAAARVSFFPPNASQSEVRSNYSSVPLPGQFARAVTSIAVNANQGAVRSTDLAAVDVHGVLNALRESLVKITADNGTTVLLREPLHKFMALAEAHVEHNISAGADADETDEWVLHLPEGGYYDLSQGFQIAAGQTFSVELIFEDGSALPAPDGYSGKPLALEVDLKTVIPASGE